MSREYAFSPMIRGLQELKRDSGRIIIDAVQEKDDDLKRIQKEQLYSGINSEGEKITPPYSKGYKRRKEKLGQPTDRVTLYLEGEYYAQIRTYYGTDFVRLFSDDFKAKWLDKNYPKNLGLDEDSKDKLRNVVRPVFQNKVRELIGIS